MKIRIYIFTLLFPLFGIAQTDSVQSVLDPQVKVPVIFKGDTLFHIFTKIGPFSAEERAVNVKNRLDRVSREPYDSTLLRVIETNESSDLVYGEQTICVITNADAQAQNLSREEVVRTIKVKVNQALIFSFDKTSFFSKVKRIALLMIFLLVVGFGFYFLNKGFTRLNFVIRKKLRPYLNGIKFKNYEIITKHRSEQLLLYGLKLIKWFLIGLIFYLTLPILFSIFPATQGIASTLFGYILYPIKTIGGGIIGYIPEMITIAVVVVITKYLLKALKFIANEVAAGKLELPGFYSDWAQPTFNLFKILIYAFAFIIIFPYLPGSDSPVFQGVSVFLGLLISLGSSSAISNIIAGLVITYMRGFKIGDRVKIGDTTGDVIDKTMLVTRIRTIKNEDVTIPNSAILSGNTVNFTSSAKTLGLILHTTVTIGYDVEWKKVHEMLISAAKRTPNLKHDPEPFVLQTSLDDFYVSYQINAYTDQPEIAAKTYSALYSNIQDVFNENGIEILSPHYRAARDGSNLTIPNDYVPDDFVAPSFKVKMDQS